jgi:hypothetical protein
LTYGDLRYFQEKFDSINSKLPKQARMEFGKSQGFSQIFFHSSYSGLALWRYSILSFSEKWEVAQAVLADKSSASENQELNF